MPGVLPLSLFPIVTDGNNQAILSNQAVTGSGSSSVFTGYGQKEINVLIRIGGTVSGTTPVITFTLQELHPGDQTTVLQSVTGSAITATATTQTLSLPVTFSDTFKVTWTVTGSTPSFGGTYVNIGTKNASTIPDYINSIARGRVPFSNIGRIEGKVTTNATTKAAINATTFTDQVSGVQRSVNSGSANDTSAGTGARTIKITYYTISSGVVAGPFTETITLNGTANVNTVATNIALIEKVEVNTVGSGLTNAGLISVFAATAGAGGTIASIAIGEKITRLAHHYVPTGSTCLLYDILTHNNASSGNTPQYTIEKVDPTNATNNELPIMMFRHDGRLGVTLNPTIPMVVVGPARIRAYVQPENAPSQITMFEMGYVETPT